jgi:hypothetical protein
MAFSFSPAIHCAGIEIPILLGGHVKCTFEILYASGRADRLIIIVRIGWLRPKGL